MSQEEGIQVGGRGDDTIKWGPDVTADFLKETGLELIVRSHQVPASCRGFGLHHNSKVITVFSASNYAGVCMNRGGVLIVPSSGAVSIEEHMALSLDELRKAHEVLNEMMKKQPSNKMITAAEAKMLIGWRTRAQEHAEMRRSSLTDQLQQRVDMEENEQDVAQERLIDNLLVSVRARVCEHKPRLQAALQARHAELCKQGKAQAGGALISLSIWRSVLENVLGLRLDWATLPPRFQGSLAIVIAEPKFAAEGREAPLHEALYPAVRYVDFLDRFHVAIRKDPTVAPSPTDEAGAAAATPPSPYLLALVHANALTLRKALLIAASSSPSSETLASSRMTSGGRSNLLTVHRAHWTPHPDPDPNPNPNPSPNSSHNPNPKPRSRELTLSLPYKTS